jgi:molecular chaperone DnaK (HSP70)
MTRWTLCIDFGTAFSKAAAAPADAWADFDPGAVRPLALAGHEAGGNPFLLDSAVFIGEHSVLFGRAAIAEAAGAGRKRMALRSFKTLLSVSDLDRALNTNAPASIDPHRVFQMRDLVVLYLAYLLAAIDRAIAGDATLSCAPEILYRYAAPAWRRGDSAGGHGAILRLFAEADAFRQAASDSLLASEGLSIAAISRMLPMATQDARAFDMGLIFEATAAAAYTSIGLEEAASHLIVLDMGAGTTDIAALARIGDRVIELPEARVTLKQAGDFIDQIIANRALEAAKWARGPQQVSLWTAVMRNMRDIKETLFADGSVIFRHEGSGVKLEMRDVERDKDFRTFMKTLKDAYKHGLAVVRDDATARRRPEIQAVAVGGGAYAPFIRDLIQSKSGRRGGIRVEPRPATPKWAHTEAFAGNLAPVFPQLAISIGGALAPDAMLAARSSLSPAASGRSDTPAARD